MTLSFQSNVGSDAFAYLYNGFQIEADGQTRFYNFQGEASPAQLRASCVSYDDKELTVDTIEPASLDSFLNCPNAPKESTKIFYYSDSDGLSFADGVEYDCGAWSPEKATYFYTCKLSIP